jgi:hypothetical protein
MNAIADLELWLIGTPAEIDAATTALARLGHVAQHSTTALAGADAGRMRTYLRISTTIHTHARTARRVVGGPSLLDAA